MDLHTFNVVISQLEQAIPHVKSAVNEAAAVREDIKSLKAQKLEAETGYRQAHSERAQIIEAIENLKKQYEAIETSSRAAHSKQMDELSARFHRTKEKAEKDMAEMLAKFKKSESDSMKRFSEANAAADAAEARVSTAEKALAALKGA